MVLHCSFLPRFAKYQQTHGIWFCIAHFCHVLLNTNKPMEYGFALHFAASLIQFCDALCSNYPRDQKIKMERVKNRPVTGAQMKYNGIPEPV